LSASAEADVVCKQLRLKLNESSSADSIHRYREQIKKAHPKICDFEDYFYIWTIGKAME
jgi:hypothetical protein